MKLIKLSTLFIAYYSKNLVFMKSNYLQYSEAIVQLLAAKPAVVLIYQLEKAKCLTDQSSLDIFYSVSCRIAT
jgi:hypothetical protein